MKYAIVGSGGKQYKAVEGDAIEVDLLDKNPASRTRSKRALLVDGDQVSVGTPLVTGAKVNATVVSHIKGPKVTSSNTGPRNASASRPGIASSTRACS